MDWKEIKTIKCIDEKITFLTNTILNNIKLCTTNKQRNDNQDKHWITPGIVHSIKKG